MPTFATFLALVSLAGLLVTCALTALTVMRLRARRTPPARGTKPRSRADARPDVSILKPIAGRVDGLEESLRAFASLEGLSYELVLSIADRDDPSRDAVDRVKEEFPHAPIRLVVGGGLGRAGANPKVDRLVAAEAIARGRVLLVSDANVRCGAKEVAEMLRVLEDPTVGCVSSPFVGSHARSLGSMVESLHLLTFVLPGNAAADAAGVPCVVGKSMALRREVLEEIGGFAAFADVLAEDQAIGLAVTAAGYRTAVATGVVENVTVRRTLKDALARQARWNKIRWVFGRARYGGEVLMNPFPFALLAALVSLSPRFVALALGVAAARVAQALVLNAVTRWRLPKLGVLLMPLKDVLQLVTQAAPLLSNEVTWHQTRARIGPGTRLLPAAA
jgi:ceramide glucosyltransferase